MITSYELILPSGDMLVLFAYTKNGIMKTSYHRVLQIANQLDATINYVL